MTQPRIYIADLAAYNNGILHGAWVDATQELDDIQDQINAILKASPIENAEEYAIHDYEGFESVGVSEYQGISEVQEIALFLEEYGALGAELFNHYSNLEEAQKAIDEAYYGCYGSAADYVQQLTEETNNVPEHLKYYIDYERMAEDWRMSGDIFTIETSSDEVHIFSGH